MVFGFGVLIFNFFGFGFGLVFACVHGFFLFVLCIVFLFGLVLVQLRHMYSLKQTGNCDTKRH